MSDHDPKRSSKDECHFVVKLDLLMVREQIGALVN